MVISEGCSTTWATVCAGTIAVTAICPRLRRRVHAGRDRRHGERRTHRRDRDLPLHTQSPTDDRAFHIACLDQLFPKPAPA